MRIILGMSNLHATTVRKDRDREAARLTARLVRRAEQLQEAAPETAPDRQRLALPRLRSVPMRDGGSNAGRTNLYLKLAFPPASMNRKDALARAKCEAAVRGPRL